MMIAAEIALIRECVGPDRCDAVTARTLLTHARAAGTDPFRAVRIAFRIPESRLYERLARLRGFSYRDDIGPLVLPAEAPARVEALKDVRSARGRENGRDILFIAPDFDRFLALEERVARDPGLKARLWLTSPAALRRAVVAGGAETLMTEAIHRLSRLWPQVSAHLELTAPVRTGFVVTLVLLVAAALLAPFALQIVLVPLVTLVLGASSAFRLWAAFTHRRNAPLDAEILLTDRDLPVYSVLIPLRSESHMVPELAAAMRRLDYPEERLDILFVVESESPATVAAVEAVLDSSSAFELVVVPAHPPGTKPKALNYALPLARGRHLVVYDAEDAPEPDQLRKAATLFAQHPRIDCLQAELVIHNLDANWLTAMFGAEYAGHFGVLLPAVARAGLPMPLGGTSNHFRRSALDIVGGWDAFNVTEDADLGLRLARRGLRVASFSSRTHEEAPLTVGAWLRQRGRWMKGWMQTLIVHNRRSGALLAELGWGPFLAVQVFMGGLVFSTALHAVFLLALTIHIGLEIGGTGGLDLWTFAKLAVLGLGYCGAAAVAVLGLAKLDRLDAARLLPTLPAYWILAAIACFRACADLLLRPFHWSKTAHHGVAASTPGAKAVESEAVERPA